MLTLLLGGMVQAAPITDQQIPAPLKPWVNWVLYNQDQYNCPSAYNNDQQRFCAWPARLNLDLHSNEGRFQQLWQIHQKTWVRLPGDAKHWPQSVTVNEQPAIVLNKKGFPSVQLDKGQQTVSGLFAWDSLPESMTIPPSTGLLNITRNGQALLFPRLNQQGQLWLDKALQQKNIENSLNVQVFRKIYDGHPMRVETRIILNVSGNSRDIVFPKAQLSGFTPLQLQSKLPARINQQGDLHIQVRPGHWVIKLHAYTASSVSALTMPTVAHENWPQQEVWVFQADASLRLADIEGIAAIDSRQTRLPKEWHQYPAYLLKAGQVMRLKTLQRGSAEPKPNQLTLRRNLWLDFDGKGYTLQDQINGTMTRGWRLSASSDLELGRVSIDGEPQFITQLNKTRVDSDQTRVETTKGVEVRRGRINLEADSRYSKTISVLPVSGWQHDFQGVTTQLFLPPGWKLFSAHGSDNLPNTWLQSWTLLDLFMVLIISVAIVRLWGWKWGIFALLTMVLIWHEADAPRYIWLNLLAILALLRVLPDGLAKKLLGSYRNLSLLALLLIVIPFVVSEVRQGLYPQLGLYANYETVSNNSSGIASYDQVAMAPAPIGLEEAMKKSSRANIAPSKMMREQRYIPKRLKKDKSSMIQQSNVLNEVDPNANIQTGPGLPIWHWQAVHFNWNSPVDPSQTLRLNFISPQMNMLLNFLRVVLLLLLLSRLLKAFANNVEKEERNKKTSSEDKKWYQRLFGLNAILFMFAIMISFSLPQNAQAKAEKINIVQQAELIQDQSANKQLIPSTKLLDTLQQRLLVADDCLPECALIEAMKLEVSEAALTIHLKVHSANNSVIPLPANGNQWRPDSVLIDYQVANALARDSHANLWLGVGKGTHIVTLQGKLPLQAQISLSLPLKPRMVTWQGKGWTVEGIGENNIPEQQLQLVRLQAKNASQSQLMQQNTILPPLLQIERTLHLGLDWNIETHITRLSPLGSAISMRIPLLPNEGVLSNKKTVKNGKIAISFGSMQQSTVWKSRIPVATRLQLTATEQQGLVESWKLDISPIWHVNITGIPEIHHATQHTEWLPQWKPWPAESILLEISRPQGVMGRTLTIERSQLSTTIGKRSRESELNLRLRSSRGGQHIITLPQGAELLSVSIDNKLQPVRQKDRLVSLPISPGEQRIKLNWREAQEITSYLQQASVDLGIDSVNHSLRLNLGADRWILFVGGPQMGPVVLFWGMLLVVLLGSVLLGRIKNSPLKIWQWFLLGVGLSLVTPLMLLVVMGWLMALNYRPQLQKVGHRMVFNLGQIGLVLLTLIAFGVLFFALQQGLLGSPDMQITGNGSTSWSLHWFQDRTDSSLPQPWVISVPLFVYRLLMLVWALWLAFALINWLKWGWNNFTMGGLWRKAEKKSTRK